jgi:septation ring formation regulator EzrA
MMYAIQASLWPYLIPAVPAFLVAVAALLGWWNARREQPVKNRLITAQTEQVESDIIHKSVEASIRTGEFTLKALERAEAEIEHVTARKEALEVFLQKELEALRRDVRGIDDKQADIFRIIGELRRAEKKGEEET